MLLAGCTAASGSAPRPPAPPAGTATAAPAGGSGAPTASPGGTSGAPTASPTGRGRTRAAPLPGNRAAAGTGAPAPAQRPAWLGTRELPQRPDGFGRILPTPPELRDRRLPPPDHGLPPPDGDGFAATIAPVPAGVAARSTWSGRCPVAIGDLRYLTVVFWGFDGRTHTGELLVHRTVAEEVVSVFRRLHAEAFPIEEMRVVRSDELDAPPTGDGNTTGGFVCRPVAGGSSWSQHAFGLAIDVNPFHNPYVRGEVVLPELASAYTDRGWRRPGMVVAGSGVVEAFQDIGWQWGGHWQGTKDWMHFSRSGR